MLMRSRDVAGLECLEGGPKATLNEAVKVKSMFQWRARDIAKNRTSVEKKLQTPSRSWHGMCAAARVQMMPPGALDTGHR